MGLWGVGQWFKLPVLFKLTNTGPFAAWLVVTGDGIRVVRSVLGAISSLPIETFRGKFEGRVEREVVGDDAVQPTAERCVVMVTYIHIDMYIYLFIYIHIDIHIYIYIYIYICKYKYRDTHTPRTARRA